MPGPGRFVSDFAAGGTIDLNKMDNGGGDPGLVNVTSAPVVFEDLVIVGSAISDNHATAMPSGFMRAFDVRTGQERWHWSPIPDALRKQTGAGNVWAPMSVDIGARHPVCADHQPQPGLLGRTADRSAAVASTPWSR